MSNDGEDQTRTLNTKVEDAFISPLTAIRGALEILRDFPDLTEAERTEFVATALTECARLETGIEHLSASVYAPERLAPDDDEAVQPAGEFADRIRFTPEGDVIELDFAGFVFDSNELVNAFFDEVDAAVNRTGTKWYFIVNNTDCRIWPEAWVAFAHRSKKVSVNFALGMVRFDALNGESDPGLETSRDAALAKVIELRNRPSWEQC